MRTPALAFATTACVLLGGGFGPPPAGAAEYHLYSCRTPAGATAPTDGWSSSLATPEAGIRNTCSNGGELHAELRGSVAAGTGAGWKFTAPDGVAIGRVRLWRSGAAAGRDASGGVPFWLISRPDTSFTPASTIEVCGQEPAFGSCVSRGDGFTAQSDQNLITAGLTGASSFWGTAQCGVTARCEGTGANSFVFLNIHAADIQLRDDSTPQSTAATGDLLADAPLSGVRSVSASVSDVGSGAYALDVELDGRRVAGAIGPQCDRAQVADDGSRAFTLRRPCPAAAELKVDLDTATVPDGDHALRIVASDAAGNRVAVAERKVTIYNTPATPTDAQGVVGARNPFAGPGHLANGSGAAEGLKPVLRLSTQGKSRVTTNGPRRPLRVLGSLTTSNGQPVVGARLAVVSKVSGRPPAQLDSFQTTDGEGRVSFLLPPGPTRSIRLAYYAFSDSRAFTLSAAVTALARTTLAFRVTPRKARAGQLVKLSGSVSKDGLPTRGVIAVMQGYQAGLGWRTFRTVRVSGANGLYTTRYRLRYSSNRLRFRVVVRNQEGYPYATTVSRSYAVRVR